MATGTEPKWTDVKRALHGADAASLLSLIQDLYKLSPENRLYLATRLAAVPPAAAIEPYRRRVIEPFYPRRGFGDLKFADARKAIRDYEKASGDAAGTLDLMLEFVENGNRFTREFGDIDAPFYNSLISMLDKFLARLRQADARALFPRFEERLQTLERRAGGIGWGYSDEVIAAIHAAFEEFRRPRNAT